MKFIVPRENLSEMVMYLWKIIDLPQISLNELIFKLSFELFLFPPNEAQKFIENAIKAKYLIKTQDNSINLSNTLVKQLNKWHEEQMISVKNRKQELNNQNQSRVEFLEDNETHFNVLLKALLDKGTINRAAAVSEDAFNIITFSPEENIIKANVKGSKEEPYNIIIDLDDKTITHNCHDFETKRAQNYKFCKHLAKLFLILKKIDQEMTNKILEQITSNIDQWIFSA
ncbi:MAG: hypothetical protein ACFE9R_04645 [Candidatus Hermodarchaeota archaeon]